MSHGLELKQILKEFKPYACKHHTVIILIIIIVASVIILLFHDGTCCSVSLVSRIHDNTTPLLNIMCTLVATSVIIWSLEWVYMYGVYGALSKPLPCTISP